MTHGREIAGIVVTLALVAALYATGFWWWVLPYRHDEPGFIAEVALGGPGYMFPDNTQARVLYYLYWPVIRIDAGERILWTVDYTDYTVN